MEKSVWIYHWPFNLYDNRKECIKYMKGFPNGVDAKQKAADRSDYWLIFNKQCKIFSTNIPIKNKSLFSLFINMHQDIDVNDEVIETFNI